MSHPEIPERDTQPHLTSPIENDPWEDSDFLMELERDLDDFHAGDRP